jgi:hypothetical protein
MARTNRTFSGKILVKVISNSKVSSQPAEDERKINKNQRRNKNGHYRRGFRLRDTTNCIYAATIDAGKIYTDQTGIFPVISSKGNKYIMDSYEYGSNAILAEPIKNRTAQELLRAIQVMEKKLTARGLQPKVVMLDNEGSQLLKSYVHDKNC